MIGKNEVSNALDGAFRAAFMLTGSTQAAELAVFDGIAETEFDSVVDDVFVLETVKAAIQRRPDSTHQSQQPPSCLPLELRRPAFLIGVSPGCARSLDCWSTTPSSRGSPAWIRTTNLTG